MIAISTCHKMFHITSMTFLFLNLLRSLCHLSHLFQSFPCGSNAYITPCQRGGYRAVLPTFTVDLLRIYSFFACSFALLYVSLTVLLYNLHINILLITSSLITQFATSLSYTQMTPSFRFISLYFILYTNVKISGLGELPDYEHLN